MEKRKIKGEDAVEIAKRLLSPKAYNQLEEKALQCDSHREFISAIMVGNCPECGSKNTHDCDAESNTCLTAQRIDAIDIGHCETCNYLWNLDTGEEVKG
jgi:hypothetical protein